MRASFPPYSKTAATPAPAAPVGVVSAFEAKLRTLKHYLYHAGLLADELLALEAPTQAASAAEVMPGDKL